MVARAGTFCAQEQAAARRMGSARSLASCIFLMFSGCLGVAAECFRKAVTILSDGAVTCPSGLGDLYRSRGSAWLGTRLFLFREVRGTTFSNFGRMHRVKSDSGQVSCPKIVHRQR